MTLTSLPVSFQHPDEIFPKQQGRFVFHTCDRPANLIADALILPPAAAQWGEDRRPFHFLFYTGKQFYYSLMHVSTARGGA